MLEEDGTVAGSEAAEALEQSRAAEVGITAKVKLCKMFTINKQKNF